MKQLIIHTGGHPITATDLKHLNEGITETLVMLVRGLIANGASIPNCILYGIVEQTAGIYTSGAAILNGEICYFNGQTVWAPPVPPNVRALVISDQYLSGNPVLYADASAKNVHLDRRCVISNNVTPPLQPTQLELGNAPRFLDILRVNILNEDALWRYVGFPGQPAYQGGFHTNFPWTDQETLLRFRRVSGNLVIVEGIFDFEGMSNAPTMWSLPSNPLLVCVLPTGYRPDKGMAYCDVSVETPDGPCMFLVRINHLGQMHLVRAYGYPATVTPSTFSGGLCTGRVFMMYKVV